MRGVRIEERAGLPFLHNAKISLPPGNFCTGPGARSHQVIENTLITWRTRVVPSVQRNETQAKG
jgi:hypothetical protein